MPSLAEILVDMDLIDEEDLNEASLYAEEHGGDEHDALIQLGYVTDEDVLEALACGTMNAPSVTASTDVPTSPLDATVGTTTDVAVQTVASVDTAEVPLGPVYAANALATLASALPSPPTGNGGDKGGDGDEMVVTHPVEDERDTVALL